LYWATGEGGGARRRDRLDIHPMTFAMGEALAGELKRTRDADGVIGFAP
jgi:hypothetical protein